MRDRGLVEPDVAGVGLAGTWTDYVKPFRLDHWIKNLVVPVGTTLAIVSHHLAPELEDVWEAAVGFLMSGTVSSINYALNEVLDAPFDARHPVKRTRPIPSGRVRVRPLLALTAVLA